MARTTLTDVAKHVGVSAKTVSNVVNNTGMVSDDVRQKVLQALRDLNYRPNLAARQLRGGRSGLISLAVPDLRFPYFSELASYFVDDAQRRGITVLINQTGGDRVAERNIASGWSLPAMDAIVLSPLTLSQEDLNNRPQGTPMILLGEYAQSLHSPDCYHVGVDNVSAAKLAVSHLIEQGRRKIGAIGLQLRGSAASSQLRLEGYKAALHAAGIAYDPDLVLVTNGFTTREATAAVRGLIASGKEFDALFCFTDWLALGALHGLALHRVRVPEDVAVIGFDSIDESELSAPPLSTIGPSPEGVAKHIFAVLDQLNGPKEAVPCSVSIQPELVVRESSGTKPSTSHSAD